MKTCFYTLLFLLVLSVDAFATYVAVLETAADEKAKDSVSFSDRQYLTNVLREQAVKELPAEQHYTIMTRENISAMLPPGKSIEDCEGSCLAETGRNIAADYICQARVGNFGGMLTLSAELYETAGNKLIASFNGRGANVNELLELIEQKSPDFFRRIKDLAEAAIAEKENARVDAADVDTLRSDSVKSVVEQTRIDEKKAELAATENNVAKTDGKLAANVGESIPANVDVKNSRTTQLVFLSISGVVAVTGGVLAYIGNRKAREAAEKGGDGSSDYDLKNNRRDAKSGQTMRGIGLIVTAVGIVGIGVSFAF